VRARECPRTTMKASRSNVHATGLLVGALFVLLALSVCVSAFAQAVSWPDPPGLKALKQQLAAAEAKKGKDHPDLVKILLDMAQSYRDAGGYVPATVYVERVLSIEENHGASRLDVAATLDKLGTLYLAQGDSARARAAYMRAQPVLLQELGANNPLYGLFLVHLSELQLRAGQTQEAQASVDQALTAFGERLSKASHEWTEMNRRVGLLLLGLGKYEEAEQQLVYALTVRSEARDFSNPDKASFYMASAQNSLGEFYVTVGRDDEAEPLLLSALSAYEKEYGNDHPLLEDVLVNLAALYKGMGNASQEQRYAERAQAVHRRSAGYSHLPDAPVRTLVRVTPPPRAGE
jgi:tetratricopeptide (TPR) repeat protein